MRKKNKLVCGWGVNDVDYPVCLYKKVSNKRILISICPYYVDWTAMIVRCYNINRQENRPTYIGCTICEEWKYLSNFIKWVDSQPNKDWQNCQPDKDFLSDGNKHYGPDTVVYIASKINSFITDSGRLRGEYMIGVTPCHNSKNNKYQSYCRNPFVTKSNYLGLFPTEIEAHKAWQAKKHEYACQLADLQDDPRVAKTLRERYAPDKDWTRA